METEKELNGKIMTITLLIQEKYPELSKYLEEMTITIPDEKAPKVSVETLNEYYNTLDAIVKNYVLEQIVKSGSVDS